MKNKKEKTETRFSFIYLLLFIIIIGLLTIFASSLWLIKNTNKSSEEIKTIERVKSALMEAQSRAKKEQKSYKIKFQNDTGIAKYSIFRSDKPPSIWEIITNDSSKIISKSEITFDSNGNARPSKIDLIVNNQKKCLLIEENTKKIKEEKDEKCDQSQ